MAGKKKQEIQLQREIETQEEWEECMAREGIWVIDVYQEWCGPCQALVTNFRRLKNELGDPLLNYAIAKADTIDALEKYRGRCEPTFLFYAGGILVSYIHGANAPKIQRTITEQLAQEHKVLEGQAERKEVKDNVMTRAAEKEIAQQEAEQMEKELEGGHKSPSRLVGGDGEIDENKEPKGITIAVIKPDVVAQGKADEIISQITEKGIEILADQERQLTEDEAVELYNELEGETYFDELVKFVTSGPCRVLVLTKGLTGESVVQDWRNIIGPTNVETAKEEAPDSLRAKYGESGYVNALHGSSTSEAAARELAFFFPQMAKPTYKKKKENIQRTLALIRPEAFNEKKDEILAKISEAGFKVALYKEIQLTKDQAMDFYKEHEEQSYFNQLIDNMTSGPVLALCLAGDEAINGWRDMLGPPNVDDAVEVEPNSLRAQYTGASGINQFHGSDSKEKATEELNFFFPMEETVAIIKPSAMGTKNAIIEKIHEAGFRIAAQKETQITQEIAEMLYPQQADKDYYDDLVQSMTSGPTMFMVLTKEDAVYGWRQVIGETDPEQAKEINPTSIRAQFGQDILNNAVHGSSDKARAKEEMKAVFGDLEFNDDGTIKGQEPQLEEASEALKIDRSSPVADTAPEHRQGETTADETTADSTQDITADTTEEATTDQTEQPTDQTEQPSAEETNADETTAGDTTQAEETTAEETEAETTIGDTTMEPTVDETQEEETQADETQADTTAGDVTQEQTTEEKTAEEPMGTDPESTTGDATTEDAKSSEETPAVTENDENKEEVKEGEKSELDSKGGSEENMNDEPKEETKQEEVKEESSEKEASTQAKEYQTPSSSADVGDSKTLDGDGNLTTHASVNVSNEKAGTELAVNTTHQGETTEDKEQDVEADPNVNSEETSDSQEKSTPTTTPQEEQRDEIQEEKKEGREENKSDRDDVNKQGDADASGNATTEQATTES